MVNVTQINVGKRSGAETFLHSQILNGPRVPMVILIQEQTASKLPNGEIYEVRNDNGPRPRAQIYIEKNLAESSGSMLIEDLSDEDFAVVSLKLKLNNGGHMNCVICSAYFKGTGRDPFPADGKIKALVDYCKTKKVELLIGADVNGHSTDYGCPLTDKRGETFVDFCLKNNLTVANIGSNPTFMPSGPTGPQTIIDVTVASQKMLSIIENWEVFEGDSHSDHKQIHFSLDPVDTETIMTRNKRKTNWKQFQSQLHKIKNMKLPDKLNHGQLDKAAFDINDMLLEAYERSSKIVKKHVTPKHCWYDDKLDNARINVERLRDISDRGKSVINRGRYVRAIREYKKMIKRAKKGSFSRRMDKMEGVKDYARLHKFFENGPAKQISTVERDDGTFTRGKEETLVVLMEKHFPGCEAQVDELVANIIPSEKPRSKKDIAQIMACTELSRIKEAIESFSPFKSPGDDGIFPALFQKAKDVVAPKLQKLFRSSLRLGYIPIAWRGALVTFIPKVGKECYRRPGAYRPISLLSFLLKLLEKLIDKKIRYVDLKDNPLCNTQHAYQAGKSTNTALHSFVTKVEAGLKLEKGASLVCYIDFQGAFDSLPTETILESARRKGVSEWTVDWLENMLKTRSIKPTASRDLCWYRPTQGTPQGAVTSPILFSLSLDSLLQKLKQEHLDCIAFADDVCIIVSGNKGLGILNDRIRRAVKIIEEWCSGSGLKINADKTQLMLFTRMKKINSSQLSVSVGGKKLEVVREAKYLGVTFDSKLSMKKHITETASKANRALWAASSYAGTMWGASPKVVRYIYEGIILPRIFYGALFYWHKVSSWLEGNGPNAKILGKIHRRACMLISGAYKGTSQASLNTILRLQPIETGITIRALGDYNRLRINGHWKGRPEHKGHAMIEKIANNAGLHIELDQVARTYLPYKNFTVHLEGETPAAGEWVRCYVDASADGERVGAASCNTLPELDFSTRLSDGTDINTAEVMAIKLLTDQILAVKLINKRIAIYSDSLEALKRIDGATTDLNSTVLCVRGLNRLASLNESVDLVWVPKRNGSYLHKRADCSAKLARNHAAVEARVGAGLKSFEKLIDGIREKEAKKNWDWAISYESCNMKKILSGPQDERLSELRSFSREDLRLFIACLTNKSTLRRDLFRMGKTDNPTCRFCATEPEDIQHVLFECRAQSILEIRIETCQVATLDDNVLKAIKPTVLVKLAKRVGIKEASNWKPP